MDLVAQLEAARPLDNGRRLLLDDMFGNEPEVLEAVKTARRDRGLSYRVIAEVLSKRGEQVSQGAVQNWLRAQGIS